VAELIRAGERVDVPDRLPTIALRDLVFFPYMVLPLLIGRPASVRSLVRGRDREGFLLLVAQHDAEVEEPGPDDVYRTGSVVRIVQVSELPDGTSRVVLEGLGRGRIRRLEQDEEGAFRSRIELLRTRETDEGLPRDPETEALIRQLRRMYGEYAGLHEQIPNELVQTFQETGDAVRMAHLMAGHLLTPVEEKQALLEEGEVRAQLEGLREILARELEILRIEEKLDEEIARQIETGRKKHYLQEQLKAIHKELDEEEGEWGALERRLREAKLPRHARTRAERELERLRRLSPAAPECAVIRTYLDWILDLPWELRTGDEPDVERAARILDEDHYGLEEVKERILDHIAVLSLVGELRGPILCLVGPPGVGKTSLGRSIARALGRAFVRVSLGGLRDEAEIRGHRRTYVGALPGRILQGMRRSGSRNPIFLLDEVDKLARDFHGDPGAALLEVLDPEQNRSFTDHYLELEFDLSDVLFLATANTLAGIPEALRDRMEVIRLPGYLHTEKRAIAERFLWPRQAERHGLDPGAFRLTDAALDRIVERYTREAGVRELDRRLARVARKLARRTAEGKKGAQAGEEGDAGPEIGADDLRELLGPPPHTRRERDEEDRAGRANGLAWTAAGGEVLDVEVVVVPGTGKVRLTGTLGDVMKESAMAAVTYARSRAGRLGLDPHFHEEVDLHIHIPEGATPKDGPSAGITIAVALISALTKIPTRGDVAMTGEITLGGRILGVGGIKEKSVAALREGIRTILLPEANAPVLETLPEEVREGVEIVTARTMDEILSAALRRVPDPGGRTDTNLLEGSIDPGLHLSP